MNSQIQPHEIKNRFCFRGITLDSEVETRANLKLVQLLALAPPGASAVGSLEKVGKGYLASIELHSPFRTFFAKALGSSPEISMNRALQKLEDQLYRWRFGSGSGNMGPRQNNSNVHLPWVRSS